jgi:bacteriocin biosynthesis cyclodehydratase domain-containing protein
MTTALTLIPGTHVLRRHDGRVQIGLDPRQAVLLPAGSDAALARLAEGEPLEPALLPLVDAGLLVERRMVSSLVQGVADAQAPAVAAVVRAHGTDAAAAWVGRSAAAVRVVAHGAGGEAVAERATRLLGEAGLAGVTGDAGPPSRDGPALLLGVGQPDRELVDDWMRRGVPHLVVRMTEGHAVVGPFVDPGRSACLRCVDAHHTDVDPTWPLLVRQHAAATGRRRTGADVLAPPEPVDPLLATLATAWAVRDLASWVEGVAPSLLSSTLVLDPALAEVEVRTWTRHPGCGCSWQAVVA